MSDHRKEQVAEVLRELIASYIESESNRDSMITITNVILQDDFKSVTLFVTVFPEHKEDAALDFLRRQRSDVRHYIKKHGRLARIPHIDFAIDMGEKSRQRIDEISRHLNDE